MTLLSSGRLCLFVAATIAAITLSGCSSSSDTTGTTGAIALSLGSTSATIAPGGQVAVVGTVTRSGGFTGDVAIAATGAPTGVTGAVGAIVTTGLVSTATVTLTIASGATPGTYPITVTASATGVTSSSVTYTLTISATGTFSVSVAPTTVNLAQVGTNTATVTITRSGGFTGSVALTATGSPANLTASFAPSTVPSGSSTSTITLTGVAGLAAGDYPITIHGTASGFSTDQTVQVTAHVTATGGGNAVVNFSACATTGQPIWFAYQDGVSGTWTVATPTNNVYTFAVAQPKVGYAYVTQNALGSFTTTVNFFTNAEVTGAPSIMCTTPGTNSMSGTVAGLSAGQKAVVAMGNSATSTVFPLTSFTLSAMSAGTFDLLGYRTSAAGTPAAGDKFIIRRNQLVTNLGTIAALDFGAAEAVSPATGTITVTNDLGATLSAFMTYYMSNCTTSGLLWLQAPTTSFTAYGVPASAQVAADFHSLFVGATSAAGTRGAIEVFHTMANRTIALPSAVTAPVVTSVTGNYKRLQAVYTLPADYTNGAFFSYVDAAGTTHSVQLSASAGFLGGSAVTIAMPVFSGLTGWLDTWAPASAAAVTTTTTASGVTMAGSICQEGYRLVSATLTGTF